MNPIHSLLWLEKVINTKCVKMSDPKQSLFVIIGKIRFLTIKDKFAIIGKINLMIKDKFAFYRIHRYNINTYKNIWTQT